MKFMQNIFLLGLPGSGKSTVGRVLAARLGRPFLDVDTLIEEEYGERVPTMYRRYGEDYFRACESRMLAKAASIAEGAVIATGGGIVMREENRTLMAEQGVRVFLQVEPGIALQRLQTQQADLLAAETLSETRPLLAVTDPLANLSRLLTLRAGSYAEADFTCPTEGKTAEQVAQEIVARLVGTGKFEGIAPVVQHVHVSGYGGKGYDIVVDWGGLGRLAVYLTELQTPKRVFLITDSNIQHLYAPILQWQFSQAGFEPLFYIVPAGEASKSQQQLSKLYDWLLEHHAERRETIIALGGGVVGDLAGYAAATYLRGVPLVQVPTSLLAQVDAAIGGKTGINHPKGKNLIGAFYHPRLVLVDPASLLTLPPREYTEGWAEIIKYGIILDTELFGLLETHVQTLQTAMPSSAELLCQIIARCIELKVKVIEKDEREQGLRVILNYGHTVAHALENMAGYGLWLHGEAVSLGMVVAATLAQRAGMCSVEDVERQNRLLAAFRLPLTYTGQVQVQEILAAIQVDKKVADKRVRWIVPHRIGEVVITPLPEELVEQVLKTFFAQEQRKEG